MVTLVPGFTAFIGSGSVQQGNPQTQMGGCDDDLAFGHAILLPFRTHSGARASARPAWLTSAAKPVLVLKLPDLET